MGRGQEEVAAELAQWGLVRVHQQLLLRAHPSLDMRSMSQELTQHHSRYSIFKMADDESKMNTLLE